MADRLSVNIISFSEALGPTPSISTEPLAGAFAALMNPAPEAGEVAPSPQTSECLQVSLRQQVLQPLQGLDVGIAPPSVESEATISFEADPVLGVEEPAPVEDSAPVEDPAQVEAPPSAPAEGPRPDEFDVSAKNAGQVEAPLEGAHLRAARSSHEPGLKRKSAVPSLPLLPQPAGPGLPHSGALIESQQAPAEVPNQVGNFPDFSENSGRVETPGESPQPIRPRAARSSDQPGLRRESALPLISQPAGPELPQAGQRIEIQPAPAEVPDFLVNSGQVKALGESPQPIRPRDTRPSGQPGLKRESALPQVPLLGQPAGPKVPQPPQQSRPVELQQAPAEVPDFSENSGQVEAPLEGPQTTRPPARSSDQPGLRRKAALPQVPLPGQPAAPEVPQAAQQGQPVELQQAPGEFLNPMGNFPDFSEKSAPAQARPRPVFELPLIPAAPIAQPAPQPTQPRPQATPVRSQPTTTRSPLLEARLQTPISAAPPQPKLVVANFQQVLVKAIEPAPPAEPTPALPEHLVNLAVNLLKQQQNPVNQPLRQEILQRLQSPESPSLPPTPVVLAQVEKMQFETLEEKPRRASEEPQSESVETAQVLSVDSPMQPATPSGAARPQPSAIQVPDASEHIQRLARQQGKALIEKPRELEVHLHSERLGEVAAHVKVSPGGNWTAHLQVRDTQVEQSVRQELSQISETRGLEGFTTSLSQDSQQEQRQSFSFQHEQQQRQNFAQGDLERRQRTYQGKTSGQASTSGETLPIERVSSVHVTHASGGLNVRA